LPWGETAEIAVGLAGAFVGTVIVGGGALDALAGAVGVCGFDPPLMSP
jgi:hypothetical protein